jgi:hypothetical protein
VITARAGAAALVLGGGDDALGAGGAPPPSHAESAKHVDTTTAVETMRRLGTARGYTIDAFATAARATPGATARNAARRLDQKCTVRL